MLSIDILILLACLTEVAIFLVQNSSNVFPFQTEELERKFAKMREIIAAFDEDYQESISGNISGKKLFHAMLGFNFLSLPGSEFKSYFMISLNQYQLFQ